MELMILVLKDSEAGSILKILITDQRGYIIIARQYIEILSEGKRVSLNPSWTQRAYTPSKPMGLRGLGELSHGVGRSGDDQLHQGAGEVTKLLSIRVSYYLTQ